MSRSCDCLDMPEHRCTTSLCHSGSQSGGFLDGTLSAFAVLLDLLLVVLCVLVLTETSFPANSGIAPKDLWAPTDLERSLAWNLEKAIQDIATPSLQTILAASITSSSYPQPPDTRQKNDFGVRDGPEPLEQAHTVPAASLIKQAPPTHNSREHANLELDLDPREKSPSPASVNIAPLVCKFGNCAKTFGQKNEYNRHQKSHTHPVKCDHCHDGFETSKDVKRHINSVHTTTQRFFCTFQKCKYSRTGAVVRGFSRKDNWRRHMKHRHTFSENMVLDAVAAAESN